MHTDGQGRRRPVVGRHALALSLETVRLRYLGAHPRLSEEEVARLVSSDDDQCVLVVERGNQLIACAQYDRVLGSDVAEVAFVSTTPPGPRSRHPVARVLASEGRRHG